MKVSKTAIFLFELMFVILVFTIAAAICSNIFAKAYSFSSESKNLTMAVLKAESAAEVFKTDVISGAGYEPAGTAYYDKDWRETKSDKDAKYVMELSTSKEGNLDTISIEVKKEGKSESIYELKAVAYGGK